MWLLLLIVKQTLSPVAKLFAWANIVIIVVIYNSFLRDDPFCFRLKTSKFIERSSADQALAALSTPTTPSWLILKPFACIALAIALSGLPCARRAAISLMATPS